MSGELIAELDGKGGATTLAVIPGTTTALVERINRFDVRGDSIPDRARFQDAAQALRLVKDFQKQLETARTSVTGPLNAALRHVNDWFRAPAAKLEKLERQIKAAMGAFEAAERARIAEENRIAQERARQEQEELARRAAKAAAAGKTERAQELQSRSEAVVAAPAETAPVKARGVSFGEYWTYTVTDEALVPREYLMLDHAKLRAQVKVTKGDTKIPGIAVTMQPQVGARGTT